MAGGAVSLFRERNSLDTFVSLGDLPRLKADGSRFLVELEETLYPVVADDVSRALSATIELAKPGDYRDLTETVIDLLELLKATFSEKSWREAVLPAARSHAVAKLVHECPFTRHSFTKPRGYPGDAGLLDFVYRHPAARAAQEAATVAGRTVMAFTVDVTACEAVRRRREVLAAKIDEVALQRPMPAILAVACGHLREAELSVALRGGRIGRLLAIDQDEVSLANVDKYRTSISCAIETRTINVRNILTGKSTLGKFDLIYAAGLYDYLEEKVAMRLTRLLFCHLNEGGRLLIPNFLSGVREEAFMETYMDWFLTYRTQKEIEGFAREVSSGLIRQQSYYEDGAGIIGYLELVRG